MARKRWSFFMTPIEHPFLRWLDDQYRGRLTLSGRTLLWAGVCAWVLLLGGLVLPLMLAFAFCAAGIFCGIALGWPFRPRVTLSRSLGPAASAGEQVSYRVTVKNTGRRVARSVCVEERGLPAELRPVGEPPVIDRLEPGETASVTLRLACHTRGAYLLPRLQAASSFPSALMKWGSAQKRPERMLVYPRFTPLDEFEIPHSRNYQPGGIAVASSVGDSTEFLGTRDFREGDRPRDLHWPSFARTGRPIVKEFQEEYFVRLAMIVDVEAKNAKAEARLEKGLSLAAGIAATLARRDYIIDIFAAGSQVHHFQAGRALAHLDNILEILASLEAGDELDATALEAELLPQARQLSAAVVIVGGWDDGRARLVQRLREEGVALRVLSLDPARPPTDLAPGELWEAA